MTLINWGSLYYTFEVSSINYKVAQNFRESLDQQKKSNLKLLKLEILSVIVSCCVLLCFSLTDREEFLNTWHFSYPMF